MDNLIALPTNREPRKQTTPAAPGLAVPLEGPTPEPATGPVPCRDWCIVGEGHGDEEYLDEQICRSVPYRLDTTNLGGHPGHTRHIPTAGENENHGELGCPPVGGHATVVLQHQQAPGEQPQIVLGIELADVEQWATLTLPEARALTGNLELAITNATGPRARHTA